MCFRYCSVFHAKLQKIDFGNRFYLPLIGKLNAYVCPSIVHFNGVQLFMKNESSTWKIQAHALVQLNQQNLAYNSFNLLIMRFTTVAVSALFMTASGLKLYVGFFSPSFRLLAIPVKMPAFETARMAG